MGAFCIEINTQTASFRNPEFQNFHKTLDLPPPTTIIGLAGAALGLNPKMAQSFFEETPFQIGIAGTSGGKMVDTWKYNRRVTNMHLYDSLLDGGVIKREHLVQNKFFLAFDSADKLKLAELKQAFWNPYFALTMGNSDALAMVKTIEEELKIIENDKLKNCVLAGDVVGEVMRNASKSLVFSIYQTSEPITFDLPTRFEYHSDYGKRRVINTSTFSFIGEEMQLNFKTKGVFVKDIFIPLFKL